MCSSKSINDLENQLQVLSKPALSCTALCMDHWLRSLEEPFSPRACTGLLSKCQVQVCMTSHVKSVCLSVASSTVLLLCGVRFPETMDCF